MHSTTRRQFLEQTLGGAALAGTAAGLLRADAAATPLRGSDQVPLGRTGIMVSRLAQGTGYNGSNHSSVHTRLGKEGFDRLLRHSLEQGITYIDMADLYGCHELVRGVIKGLPRDRFVLGTKIWPRKETWCAFSGGARQEVDRFRQELGVERIDTCLIHAMLNENWPREFARVRDELADLKRREVVRAVGVSCHHLEALKVAATDPWVDVIFARVNYKAGKAYSCDGSLSELSSVLKTARAQGKAVVGMKIFGAGRLVKAEEKDASLRCVFGGGLVDAITVGMLSTEQVDDTLRHISQV